MIVQGFLRCFYCFLLLVSQITRAEITAESVLGEYWLDPLFGVAAESRTIQVEILKDRLWPESIVVPASETIRFVFLNKSGKAHLYAFAEDMDSLKNDAAFQKFIADELYHATQSASSDPRSHSHADSSIDDAEAIVKSLAQRPTVFLKANETKEILVQFSETGSVALACVLDDHELAPMSGSIEVFVNEQ